MSDTNSNSTLKTVMVAILAIISVFYLINPTAGIFEILPDNIPLIGNIDEGLASYILFSCVEFFRGKRIGLFGKKPLDKTLTN